MSTKAFPENVYNLLETKQQVVQTFLMRENMKSFYLHAIILRFNLYITTMTAAGFLFLFKYR